MVSWYEAILFCDELTEKITGSKDECVYTFKDIKEENGVIVDATVTYDFSKKSFRLPTEVGWEYATKGGDIDVVYAGGKLHLGEQEDKEQTVLNTLAWYNKNSAKVTHQVAKKAPNGYGLYDMSGNGVMIGI